MEDEKNLLLLKLLCALLKLFFVVIGDTTNCIAVVILNLFQDLSCNKDAETSSAGRSGFEICDLLYSRCYWAQFTIKFLLLP
jgi:hypothetical protein